MVKVLSVIEVPKTKPSKPRYLN